MSEAEHVQNTFCEATLNAKLRSINWNSIEDMSNQVRGWS